MQGTSPFPRPGDTIAGRYHLDAQLGSGASSRVYAATQTRLDRRVALKITSIPPQRDTETYNRWTERFERGARVLSNLTNPHVVDVYDFGETDSGQLYMAMELVDGQTLEDRIDRAPLTARDAAQLGVKLLEALDEAHHHGVLHRDIKPANIMLAHEGQVRLLDFGVAKPIDANNEHAGLTQENVFVGTPRYAAPEYLLGGDLGPWCDVYSLGLVLWESVAGRPLVVDSDTQSSLRRHMNPEPFELDPSLVRDDTFRHIIATMIDKDPARRYPTASQAAHALERFLAGEDVALRDSPAEGVPSIDPNLDQPSDFFVNAPRSLSADAAPADIDQDPFGGRASDSSTTRRRMPPPHVQQARAEETPAVETQSTIAEDHDDEHSPRARADGSRQKSNDNADESVPVPAHIEQMLESGERKADRLHRFKWIAFFVLIALGGAAAAVWMFAPPYWQAKLGLDTVRQAGERSVVNPVRDRVAPEHAEVSAEGIFRVIESSGWTPRSERGEIQTDKMSGWTQDYALDDTRVRVEVFRFTDRPAARARLDEVSSPNRGMRFAKRVVVLKPLDETARDESIEGLQMMLEEYRDMVDAASRKGQ